MPISRLLTLLLAAAGGWVTTLAFPDVGWWPAAFVGVGLLMVAASRDSARWGALVGLVWGLVFFAVHIHWAAVATAVVPWVALSTLEAGFVAAACAAYVWARRAPRVGGACWYQVAAFTACFVAAEQARSVLPFGGFPWGLLAFSQDSSPLGRLAWLGGETLVSAAVVVVGATLAVAATRALPRWGRSRASSSPTRAARANTQAPGVDASPASNAAKPITATPRTLIGCAVVIAFVVGAPLAIHLDNGAQAGTLKVGAVQGNVAEPGDGAFANRGEVLGNHVQGTFKLLDQVSPGQLDLVLWPENGSDEDPQQVPAVADEIDVAARAVDAPILVGAQEFPPTGGRYNVLLLWEPGVGVVDRYAKQHPAPFGEYIPMRGILKHLSNQVARVNTDMLPGHGVGLMRLPSERLGRDVPLGTLICFEVAYEPLVYASVNAGAQVLIIPTNNASFGFTPESTQQLAMSRLRAIETGRATVQISTVGVSGIILPNGHVTQSTKLFTADQMVADLPLRTSMTPAMRLGSAPTWTVEGLAIAMMGAGIAASVVARRRARPGADTATGRAHEPDPSVTSAA